MQDDIKRNGGKKVLNINEKKLRNKSEEKQVEREMRKKKGYTDVENIFYLASFKFMVEMFITFTFHRPIGEKTLNQPIPTEENE